MKKTFSVIGLLCFIFFACGQKSDDSKKWVNDFENVLSENQIYVLDSIIRDFEARTTNEIMIVTVKDMGDSPKMVDFAVEFGNRIGID